MMPQETGSAMSVGISEGFFTHLRYTAVKFFSPDNFTTTEHLLPVWYRGTRSILIWSAQRATVCSESNDSHLNVLHPSRIDMTGIFTSRIIIINQSFMWKVLAVSDWTITLAGSFLLDEDFFQEEYWLIRHGMHYGSKKNRAPIQADETQE